MSHDWQPIETVPKDGRQVRLRLLDGREVVARWLHPQDDWSLGPAKEQETAAESLLNGEPTERVPS